MTPAVEIWNRLANAWAGLAWAVTWQSAILVGLFALVAAGLRRASPGLRYGLWQVAAIKLLLMPLWTVAILLPALPRPHPDPPADVKPTARPVAQSIDRLVVGLSTIGHEQSADGISSRPWSGWAWIRSVDWTAWLMLGWGMGLSVQVAAIFRQRGRLNRLLSRSAVADDPTLLGLVGELSSRIGLRAPPDVLLADAGGSPFVCGMRRPSLVLPRDLGGSLESGPFRAVLLHELAHIRRRDLILDWIPTIARVVYWFHPAAHYVADRARLERELACDQAAMVFADQDAADYASILVDVVSRSSEVGLQTSPFPRSHFRRLS
jgi:beta-lactamase regulating signal transducer with metallopeptidase domain